MNKLSEIPRILKDLVFNKINKSFNDKLKFLTSNLKDLFDNASNFGHKKDISKSLVPTLRTINSIKDLVSKLLAISNYNIDVKNSLKIGFGHIDELDKKWNTLVQSLENISSIFEKILDYKKLYGIQKNSISSVLAVLDTFIKHMKIDEKLKIQKEQHYANVKKQISSFYSILEKFNIRTISLVTLKDLDYFKNFDNLNLFNLVLKSLQIKVQNKQALTKAWNNLILTIKKIDLSKVNNSIFTSPIVSEKSKKYFSDALGILNFFKTHPLDYNKIINPFWKSLLELVNKINQENLQKSLYKYPKLKMETLTNIVNIIKEVKKNTLREKRRERREKRKLKRLIKKINKINLEKLKNTLNNPKIDFTFKHSWESTIQILKTFMQKDIDQTNIYSLLLSKTKSLLNIISKYVNFDNLDNTIYLMVDGDEKTELITVKNIISEIKDALNSLKSGNEAAKINWDNIESLLSTIEMGDIDKIISQQKTYKQDWYSALDVVKLFKNDQNKQNSDDEDITKSNSLPRWKTIVEFIKQIES